jgi:hypothetical protein
VEPDSPLHCTAWISMPSTLSPADQKCVVKMAERWATSLLLLDVVDGMSIFHIANNFVGRDRSFELLVSFLPVWHRGALADRDLDVVGTLRKQENNAHVSIFIYAHQNVFSFGMILYDETRDLFKLHLPKDVSAANRLLASMFPVMPYMMTGACNPVASLKPNVLGIMTFMFDTCPAFCFVLCQVGT